MRGCLGLPRVCQKLVRAHVNIRQVTSDLAMLTFLNIAQLVLYIALLALLGQGLLFVLAGSRRETNLFYRLLQVIARPFTVPVRKLTPRQVADRHVPVVTFFLLAILYIVVTFEKIDHCIAVGMVGCR